jgi:hypothetical protein
MLSTAPDAAEAGHMTSLVSNAMQPVYAQLPSVLCRPRCPKTLASVAVTLLAAAAAAAPAAAAAVVMPTCSIRVARLERYFLNLRYDNISTRYNPEAFCDR